MKTLLNGLFFIILSANLYSQRDIIYLKSGKGIQCEIYKEDSTTIYFHTTINEIKRSTFVKRSDVMNINYGFENIKTPYSPYNPLNYPYLNLGLGFGSSHGILGAQAILGRKNSGLLLGLGTTLNGLISPAIGLQGSLKWFFVNVGYGTRGEIKYDEEPYHLVTGIFYNLGAMINIGKTKKYYFEIGLGNVAKINIDKNRSSYQYYNYAGSLGFGYRISN